MVVPNMLCDDRDFSFPAVILKSFTYPIQEVFPSSQRHLPFHTSRRKSRQREQYRAGLALDDRERAPIGRSESDSRAKIVVPMTGGRGKHETCSECRRLQL